MSLMIEKKSVPKNKENVRNDPDKAGLKKENADQKFKNWIMPKHPERYLKPKPNDPL
jgi:hypothetical protein